MSKTKINESQLDLTNITNRVSRLEQIQSGGLVYKGNVATVNDLPDTENVTGWFYTVGLASEVNKPEYVWLEDHWEELGTTVTINGASEDTAGIIELATKDEALGGVDATKAITPNTLKANLDLKADKATTYTKTEVDEKIAGATPSIPDNVYTEDNLIAGNNVTITEVLPEGGIDNHTLACWHFDGSNINAIAGKSNYPFTAYDYVSSEEYFNKCLQMYSGTSTTNPFLSNNFGTKDFTFDFILKHELITGTALILMLGLDYSEDPYIIFNSENTRFITGSALDVTKPYTPNTWIHIAAVRNSGIVYWFLNGTKIGQANWNKDISAIGYWQQVTDEATKYYIDEVRISDIARWTNDFNVPTKPYSIAEPTGKRQINAVIPDIDLNGYVKKSGDTMTGPLTVSSEGIILPEYGYYNAKIYGAGSVENKYLNIEAQGGYINIIGNSNNQLIRNGNTGNWFLDDGQKGVANGIASLDANAKVPSAQIPVATDSTLGGVKVDGTTITATDDGVISAKSDSGKADTNLGNVASNLDYVVESYHDEDGNWYRVYKSGWVEQGGHVGGYGTITFLKPFVNTKYTITFGGFQENENNINPEVWSAVSWRNKTTTGFSYGCLSIDKRKESDWEAKGMGAN